MSLRVTARTGVTIIGGGTVTAEDAALARAHAPVIVAADGGAASALALGLMPDAVIGDLDSLPEATRAALPPGRIHRIAEQDSTDFEKCLSRIDAPFVLGIGLTGGRLDHTLAVLTAMMRPGPPPCLLLAAEEVAFRAPPELTLHLPPGTRFSLYPMGEVTGRSEGLRWPLDGLALSPATRVGTSNETAAPSQRLRLDGPCLVLLPRAHLGAALAACGERTSG